MIASRRRAHRLLVYSLAPLASVVFVAALMSRASIPSVESLPGFERVTGTGEGQVLWSRDDLFADWPVEVVAYTGSMLELKPLRPFVKPDVLLYWTPGEFKGAALPSDAYLLGKTGGTLMRRFMLPGRDHTPENSGTLILYSLGHQEIVATAVLPAQDGATQR